MIDTILQDIVLENLQTLTRCFKKQISNTSQKILNKNCCHHKNKLTKISKNIFLLKYIIKYNQANLNYFLTKYHNYCVFHCILNTKSFLRKLEIAKYLKNKINSSLIINQLKLYYLLNSFRFFSKCNLLLCKLSKYCKKLNIYKLPSNIGVTLSNWYNFNINPTIVGLSFCFYNNIYKSINLIINFNIKFISCGSFIYDKTFKIELLKFNASPIKCV